MERRAADLGSVVALMPWRSVLNSYQLYLRASSAAESTIRLRMHHARRFARLAPEPSLVTPDMLLGMLAANLAAESRKAIRSSARSAFGWMLDEGIITDNPAAKLPRIRVPQGIPRPAPDAVIATAILLSDSRCQAMIMLAAYAGLRCCEIAKVHASDIVDGALIITGKGGKVRRVPLHPTVRDSLPAVEGYLFPGNDDGHLSPLHVCKIIARALPDGWTAHKLRHRFATAAYAVERDLFAVQQLLGHSSPTTTARYTALPSDALDRAVLGAGPAA
jgi:integrase